MRGRAKKDANHDLIVEAISKAGGCSLDLFLLGRGVPDLLVNTRVGVVVFAEVKNPDNFYGKSGLTEAQKKWAEQWRGAPVFVLRTIENAIDLVQGRFDKLESHGGVIVFKGGRWADTSSV